MKIQTLVVGQLGVNCYLVIDESTNSAAVIDPGDNPGEIEAAVRAAGVEVKHILFTHGHPDHTFSAGQLQQNIDVDVLMHEADIPQLDAHQDLVMMFYDINRYIAPRFGRFLGDGDVIELGKTELKAVHTPGHTPGGLCFVSGKVAFTGDTLFARGVGRTDLLGGSFDQLTFSIHSKLLTLPDDTVIYPGHGPSSTIGTEKSENTRL